MDSHDNYQPLQITATMRTAVVADEFLTLDGVLLYQAMRQKHGAQLFTLPGGYKGELAEVPLRVINRGEPHWYYACSWAYPTRAWWLAEGVDYWNKRFDNGLSDVIDFANKRGKVIIEQGQFKAYHMPIFYKVVDKITWFAVGDAAKIEQLLFTMTHIGKKTSQGWGEVIRWQVEPIAEDWSSWKDGKLTRAVPLQNLTGHSFPLNMTRYGVRPPYYLADNQCFVAMP